MSNDLIALVDLDGTVADYDLALNLAMKAIQSPEEKPYTGREHNEPDHIENRRMMIQSIPGFWRNLPVLEKGMEVVAELRNFGFTLNVLTKGPKKTLNAWTEKAEWCAKHLPDALVTITRDKSYVYGRVLFDDFPPYFNGWLEVRPRGLVVCLAHSWNLDYAEGGKLASPNVFRYDGTNRQALREKLDRAYSRAAKENL